MLTRKAPKLIKIYTFFRAERGNARKYMHVDAQSAEILRNIYIFSARSVETLEFAARSADTLRNL